MTTELLNLNQSPEVLDEIHGKRDYYAYLRSAPFIDTFIRPLAETVNRLSLSCLDVGCGEGVLSDFLKVPYQGIEGSAAAVAKAHRDRPGATVELGRIEDPAPHFVRPMGTIVFGGIFSVLVKPERQLDFLDLYARTFLPLFFVAYEMEHIDISAFEENFQVVSEYHATISAQRAAAELPGIEPVKLTRKIVAYRF